MKFTVEDIQSLYESEARRHGEAGTATIQDIRTRRLEMAALSSYVRDGLKVLEVGCGNGYVAQAMVERFDVDLDAFDFSEDMIAVAKTRHIEGARGRVTFFRADVLAFDRRDRYDLAFTERCVQNLVSWEDQKAALRNIVGAIMSGGMFVMLESFRTGLDNLNAARRELGIEEIAESWHNNFFDENETKAFLGSIGCSYLDQNCFLSGYYFGSRVLLPALLPEGKRAASQSILNDYFCALPAAGDFAPMKILRFLKA